MQLTVFAINKGSGPNFRTGNALALNGNGGPHPGGSAADDATLWVTNDNAIYSRAMHVEAGAVVAFGEGWEHL